METTEKTLVLKVGRFREVDAWVKLFSPRRGIFNAFAFGGSVSRRRFLGCLDPFNVVLFKVRTDTVKGYTYLLEGTLEQAHPQLRQDADRQGMAVNCLKFLEASHLGHPGSDAAFALLLETLDVLETHPSPPRLIPLMYRARMAFDQGFRPDLSACARCGADLSVSRRARMLVEQGKFHCEACLAWGKGAGAMLGREALGLLGGVEMDSPSGWAQIQASGQARMELARALDLYVEHHLGLTWDHGSFRRI